MKYSFFLFLSLIICSCSKSDVGTLSDLDAGLYPKGTITIDGVKREFSVYIPKNISQNPTAVIGFHGLGGSKDTFPISSKFNIEADKHGFLLIYPSGLDQQWSISPEKTLADLKFTGALIDLLITKYKVNKKKIFAMGMSNGAYFSNQVGKAYAEKIAGVVVHSGTLGAEAFSGIVANRKFPVMIIHGMADPLISIDLARKSRDIYLKEKHNVEYYEFADLGHEWAHKYAINDKIDAFFLKYSL
jgi:polyhydroxybutyrate depolymerase